MNLVDFTGNASGVIWLWQFKKRLDLGESNKIHTDLGGIFVYLLLFWTITITIRAGEFFVLVKTFR